MENDFIKKPSKQYRPRFGKIAVVMGVITVEQLKEALIEQVEDDLADKPHRVIGSILFEHSWITKEQIDIVLKELLKLLKEHD